MINSRAVIAIVPKLPPAINGVGDYALNIALQLRKDFNIQTHFIVGSPDWIGAAEIEGFTVSQVNSLSSDALMFALSNVDSTERDHTPVLLHYVGYGYAVRGYPKWLVDGLKHWKSTNAGRSLVTMFHEIYASGPIWTSTFWLSSLQKRLATNLAILSDSCLTSKQLYSSIIKEMSHGKHEKVLCLPVFSNVGEPDQLPLNLSERDRRLVIFGGIANRVRVYQESQQALNNICQRFDIHEICDVGITTGITPHSIGKTPIIEMGQQPSDQISKILSCSFAGFFNYNPAFLAKSTIFSAYCAHRLLPISAMSNSVETDGIIAGQHYWSDNPSLSANEADIQLIADNAYNWYQSHNLLCQANTYKMTIFQD
jgi:hypothetical protein